VLGYEITDDSSPDSRLQALHETNTTEGEEVTEGEEEEEEERAWQGAGNAVPEEVGSLVEHPTPEQALQAKLRCRDRLQQLFRPPLAAFGIRSPRTRCWGGGKVSAVAPEPAPAIIGAATCKPQDDAGNNDIAESAGSDAEEVGLLTEPSVTSLSKDALAAARAAAAAAAAAAGDAVPPRANRLEKWQERLKMPVFVLLWYFFNVQYNIENKRLLAVFPLTWAVAWIQLFAGCPMVVLMWAFGFVQFPVITKADIWTLVPVAAFFAVAQVCTVASLCSMAVSFTHVVKALEPAATAFATAVILKEVFHPAVYLSLIPVFAGVAMASASEVSFALFGFATAMLSNFALSARNVLATKFDSVGDMGADKVERMTNQLSILTLVATVLLLPLAIASPGGLLDCPPAWHAALDQNVPAAELVYRMAASGFHFYMYQLSSFWALSQASPMTYSVLNTLKRVVIIIASVVVLRNPLSMGTAVGAAVAIAGGFLYLVAKRRFPSSVPTK